MGHGQYAEVTTQVATFDLDRYKVSVAQYRLCVQAGVCKTPGVDEASCNWSRSDHEDHPINCVSERDAQDYCGWIGRRLPTSYEWEYAARGTASATYAWGETAPNSQGCWGQANGTCPLVRTGLNATLLGKSNNNGVFELQGNVVEWTSTTWCEDLWTPMSSGCDAGTFYWHGAASWNSKLTDVTTAAYVGRYPADTRVSFIGFRCAKTPPSAAARSPR